MAEGIAQRMTLKRLTSPQDIANTVVYLVSDMGSSMTGQCLSV
jgi:enoyl-[acyl-carrier-protein] reductase (NADH)